MTEGSAKLVPPHVADGAQDVLDHMSNEDINEPAVREFLQKLIDAPHWKPKRDPWVHVSYTYNSNRHGSFTSEARIRLSTYLAVRVKGAHFSWSDVLGKHSEVECTDDKFEAYLTWPEYKVLQEEDCSDQWNEALEREDSDDDEDEDKERTRIIKEVVAARLAELGPFLPGKPEVIFGDEVKWLKERVLNHSSSSSSSSKKQKLDD